MDECSLLTDMPPLVHQAWLLAVGFSWAAAIVGFFLIALRQTQTVVVVPTLIAVILLAVQLTQC